MDNDPKLKDLLHAWEVAPARRQDFNPSVWKRISAESAASSQNVPARIVRWICEQLPRPAYAVSLLAATVVASVIAGDIHAAHVRDTYRLENARRYLASIDPLEMNQSQPGSNR